MGIPTQTMKILVTGGCGYTGVLLTQTLLESGHQVVVVDIQWFGNALEPHPALTVVEEDIREMDPSLLEGVEAIFHLANIVNDPSGFGSHPVMGSKRAGRHEIGLGAVRAGVQRFIYASSGSVYGVQNAERVTEELPLVPISVYNKTKMVAERVLLSYMDRGNILCTPGHRMRSFPTPTLGCGGQHAHFSSTRERENHRLWRRPNAPQHTHQGFGSHLFASTGFSSSTGNLQCRFRKPFHPRNRRARAGGRSL